MIDLERNIGEGGYPHGPRMGGLMARVAFRGPYYAERLDPAAPLTAVDAVVELLLHAGRYINARALGESEIGLADRIAEICGHFGADEGRVHNEAMDRILSGTLTEPAIVAAYGADVRHIDPLSDPAEREKQPW